MACGSATCQSGCYKDEDDGLVVNTEKNNLKASKLAAHGNNLCIKCKINKVIATAVSGDGGRFCSDCFRSNLFGKFRFAVTSNSMISPIDRVLIAFSGGPSSRVALQFVHEMQHKAQKNFDACRDRSLPVFGVGVAFIDESAIFSVRSHEIDEVIQDMKSIVSSLSPPTKEMHIVQIENVYSSDSSNGRARLKELLDAVNDVTGKEDLVLHLRMLSLQKFAFENGYNKLMLGSCTSRIACHVLSATVKGQGYSLPADIQYVDSRWDIPVVLPLRDCLSQELNMLCRIDGLKTLEVVNGPRSGINGLISSFVTLLQEENPARECTIVRTAGKLIPFHFNRIPDSADSDANSVSQRRRKKFNVEVNESISSELFCPICNSPLNKAEMQSVSCQTSGDTFGDFCCSSCRFQILPKDVSSMESFSSLLPQAVISRAKNDRWPDLREQIQDCLLSDSGDET